MIRSSQFVMSCTCHLTPTPPDTNATWHPQCTHRGERKQPGPLNRQQTNVETIDNRVYENAFTTSVDHTDSNFAGYVGIILGMGSANESRHYILMSSFIGWDHTQNDAWTHQKCFSFYLDNNIGLWCGGSALYIWLGILGWIFCIQRRRNIVSDGRIIARI